MYFTNLSNTELELYPGRIQIRNMSLSLLDMLNSDLFKTVNLGGGLYKIFPLFYCREITSNNKEVVKILDNKCIITSNMDNLFFNFLTDDEGTVIFNDVDVPLFDIGDTISTNDFNNYIQLLRDNIEFKDEISINDGLVHGVYADYNFNLDNVTVVDNGILITEETITSTVTVRLVDPIFRDDTYQLKVKVFSVQDINVMESDQSNIVTDTFLIDLEEFEDVLIPLNDLDFSMIVGFDVEVLIKQDTPIIKLNKILELSASEGPYYVGDSLSLSATYKENNVNVGSGVAVTFRNRNTSIGTAETNNNGVATYSYIPQSASEFLFKCIVTDDGVSSDFLHVNVVKKPTKLSLSSSSSAVVPGADITVSGVLTFEDSAVPGKTVVLTTNDGDSYSLTTDGNGAFSKTFNFNTDKDLTVSASFSGDSVYDSSASEFIIVRWLNVPDNIVLSSSSSTVYVDDTIVLSANVSNTLDAPCEGFNVSFYNGNTLLGTSETDINGVANLNYKAVSSGSLSLTAKCEGVVSDTVSVSVSKYTTALSCGVSSSNVNVGANITVTGRLTVNSAGISGQSIRIYNGSSLLATATTDSSGNYSATVNCNCRGSMSINSVFSATTKYKGKTSSNNGVTINGYSTSISGTVSTSKIVPSESIIISGNCSVAYATVNIYQNNVNIGSVSCDRYGNYSKTISGLSVGSYSYSVEYLGDSCTYYGSTASCGTVQVVNKINVNFINGSFDSSTGVATVKLVDEDNNPIHGVSCSRVYDYSNGTSSGGSFTDSNGVISETLRTDAYNIVYSYNGSDKYSAASITLNAR